MDQSKQLQGRSKVSRNSTYAKHLEYCQFQGRFVVCTVGDEDEGAGEDEDVDEDEEEGTGEDETTDKEAVDADRCQRVSKLPVRAKNPHNPSTGTGGARAAISRLEAVAATTRTVNSCGPAHPCRSLRLSRPSCLPSLPAGVHD